MEVISYALWACWASVALWYIQGVWNHRLMWTLMVRIAGTIIMTVALWELNLEWFFGLTVATVLVEWLANWIGDKEEFLNPHWRMTSNVLTNLAIFAAMQLVAQTVAAAQ